MSMHAFLVHGGEGAVSPSDPGGLTCVTRPTDPRGEVILHHRKLNELEIASCHYPPSATVDCWLESIGPSGLSPSLRTDIGRDRVTPASLIASTRWAQSGAILTY